MLASHFMLHRSQSSGPVQHLDAAGKGVQLFALNFIGVFQLIPFGLMFDCIAFQSHISSQTKI